MTRCLLDTTALIDFSKGREPATSIILAMLEAGDELGICAVNVAEFYAGLPPEHHVLWDKFLGSLHYWDITREATASAGSDRYRFARQGQQLATTDVLIATVARQHKAVIVTDNLKDYPMTDIQLRSLKK